MILRYGETITFVVDAGLDALAEGDAELGLLVLELLVELGVLLENVGQEVVVVLEVGQLGGHLVRGAQEGRVLSKKDDYRKELNYL